MRLFNNNYLFYYNNEIKSINHLKINKTLLI